MMVLKLVAITAVLSGLALIVSRLNLRRDMHRLDVGFLSGAPEGNYHTLVGRLSELASAAGGRVRNVSSEGSRDNVQRLGAASRTCEVAFALAQDGTDWGVPPPVLLGRLPKAESVFLLGKDADRVKTFAQLAKMKVGIGPKGSGAERVGRQWFELPDIAGLGLVLSNHTLIEQLDLAQKGELDLALVVMDEDAALVRKAVAEQGLQIAGLGQIDVVARRIPHFRTGRIGAGQYDAVRVLPAEDKRVLRVETLVLANRCAGRSATIDVLALLERQFPDFVHHNKDTYNGTGLELSATAKDYLEHGGPEIADEYAPWFVDLMPPANWAYVVMGVSILFNVMGFGHRFRLWRIDAARVDLEGELARSFGVGTTLGDISSAGPMTADTRRHVAEIASEIEELSARSRRYSLSVLVPMGQEMAYRYQEELMHQTLTTLRELLRKHPADA